MKIKPPHSKIKIKPKSLLLIFVSGVIISEIFLNFYLYNKVQEVKNEISKLSQDKENLSASLGKTSKELDKLKNEDQLVINETLKKEIKDINSTFKSAVSTYENLLRLKEKSSKTEALDNLFTKTLILLSERKYEEASKELTELENKIKDEESKLVEAVTIPKEVPSSNNPPGSGYSRQSVTTDVGTFMVSLIAADLASTKVIVDTASASNCPGNCPVLALADYIARNGAYAGVNGSYFCPSTYPSCVGKENSFDTLLMNKDKTYFNSDNNVYSTNPAVIFGSGWIRFVSQSLEWGRDTSIDSMISNYPMLVQGGNIAFGGDNDPKKGSKGSRSFVANKGNIVYIGVVHSVTVAEGARVMKALGMENALNLDDGGSTALWSGGYKTGPGRALPNAILFIKR